MFVFMGVSELILPVRTALHSVTSSAVTAQKTGQGQHSPAHTGEPSLGLALHRMQAKLFFTLPPTPEKAICIAQHFDVRAKYLAYSSNPVEKR